MLEWGPHSVLPSSPRLIQLAEEAGISDSWTSAAGAARRRYVYRAGKARALPGSPFGIPFSTALSPLGWLRVLSEPFRSNGGSEEESVKDFFQRRLGAEAARILADAMVAGISGGVPEDLEMASFAPAVAEMERKHGSLFKGLISRSRPKGVPFRGTGTLKSGMQSLPEALARGLGEAYQGSNTVTEMYRENHRWNLSVEGAYSGDTAGFDGVILATPSAVSAKLARPHNYASVAYWNQFHTLPWCSYKSHTMPQSAVSSRMASVSSFPVSNPCRYSERSGPLPFFPGGLPPEGI